MFVTYLNGDYAVDKDGMRSTGAYVVKTMSSAVDCSSKLQIVMAQSTTEVEYVAAV